MGMTCIDTLSAFMLGASASTGVIALTIWAYDAINWRLAKRKADAIEAKLRRVGLMS